MQLKEMVETPKEPTQPVEGIPHTEEPPQENKLKQFMLGLSQRKEGK
jgi:hypothetical protein